MRLLARTLASLCRLLTLALCRYPRLSKGCRHKRKQAQRAHRRIGVGQVAEGWQVPCAGFSLGGISLHMRICL